MLTIKKEIIIYRKKFIMKKNIFSYNQILINPKIQNLINIILIYYSNNYFLMEQIITLVNIIIFLQKFANLISYYIFY